MWYPFDRFVYGRIRRTRFRLVERPVKLISAPLGEPRTWEVGGGGERKNWRGNSRSAYFRVHYRKHGQRETDRSRVSLGIEYMESTFNRPAFTTFHGMESPPFVADPINSGHIKDAFLARKLAARATLGSSVAATYTISKLRLLPRFRYRVRSDVNGGELEGAQLPLGLHLAPL